MTNSALTVGSCVVIVLLQAVFAPFICEDTVNLDLALKLGSEGFRVLLDSSSQCTKDVQMASAVRVRACVRSHHKMSGARPSCKSPCKPKAPEHRQQSAAVSR